MRSVSRELPRIRMCTPATDATQMSGAFSARFPRERCGDEEEEQDGAKQSERDEVGKARQSRRGERNGMRTGQLVAAPRRWRRTKPLQIGVFDTTSIGEQPPMPRMRPIVATFSRISSHNWTNWSHLRQLRRPPRSTGVCIYTDQPRCRHNPLIYS